MKPHHDLLWVEYREIDSGRWVPFAIATGRSHHGRLSASFHDVEWSKRDESLYAHESGGGGAEYHASTFCLAPKLCAKLYVSADVPIVRSAQVDGKWTEVPCAREDLPAMGYEIVDAPLSENPLADCESDVETQYCQVCDDHLPSDGDRLCGHLFWMSWGEWGGCGSSDVREETVRKILRLVFATLTEAELVALRTGLLGRHYSHRVDGFLLGPEWLTLVVGGRWSDGHGGGSCRSKDAPPDVDDPEHGSFLVPFPVPDGPNPGPTMDLGPKITAIAERLRDDGDQESEWMDGVSWLRSLHAGDDCREAEAFAADCITDWLADAAGFRFAPPPA